MRKVTKIAWILIKSIQVVCRPMDVYEPMNDYEIAASVNQVDIDIQYEIQEVKDLKDKYDSAVLEIKAK